MFYIFNVKHLKKFNVRLGDFFSSLTHIFIIFYYFIQLNFRTPWARNFRINTYVKVINVKYFSNFFSLPIVLSGIVYVELF